MSQRVLKHTTNRHHQPSRMNQKTSRNKKHKYSNEENLVLGENKNTSALINIVQEDDSNILNKQART